MLLPMMFSSACATNGAATDGCTWVKPIFISKSDVLTEGTARGILAHNESWEAICKK